MPVTSWALKPGNQRWSAVEKDIRYDYRFARRTLQKDREAALLWLARGYGVPWERMEKWADEKGLR